MTKQNTVKKKITAQEAKLLEGLRRHPEMMERVQSILEIASNENGPLKSADEVEEMVIEQMRRLGHSTMSQWAMTAEERVSTELQRQDPTVLSRKKNDEVVVRLWMHRGARANLEQRHANLSTTTARTIGSQAPRAFPSLGSSADRFWL